MMSLSLLRSTRILERTCAGKLWTVTGRPQPVRSTNLYLRCKTTGTASTADVAKSKRMLAEMENVMGEKSAQSSSAGNANAAAGSQTDRAAVHGTRRRQALVNAGISFLTVLLSAQLLKTATLKKKTELRVEVLEEILESKQRLLRELESKETLRPVAAKCAAELGASKQTARTGIRPWWGGSAAARTVESLEDEYQDLTDRILALLQAAMHEQIGLEGMTQAEKDKVALQELQPEDMLMQSIFMGEQAATTDDSDQLLQELEPQLQLEQADGTTIIKTRVFSI